MVRWGVLYCILTLVTVWMVAFVAALQFASDHGDQDDIICKDATDCLAISLRELVLPAWSPEHIRPTQEAPVMAVLVLIFQLFFIPFALTIVLHPLLQLSNFIGRFLRIVVQSLHKDALDYIENYLEGEDWYRRWQLKLSVSVNVGTQMKLWASDFGRKRDIFSLPIGEYAESVMSNIVLPAKVIFAGNFFSEIICKSEFASFEENRRFDRRILDFKFLNPVIKRYNNIARKPVVHLINLVLTLTSIAFIFAISSSYSRGGALVIVSTIVHLLSILSSLLIIPKDLAFIVTLVSCGSLFASVVLILLQSPKTNKFYALRFISLLRLAQLQVFPFRRARFFFKTFFNTGLNIVFPVVVVGSLSYVAELLRAQIYLVQHQKTDGSGHGFSGNWGDLSYPEQLASARRRNPAMPNLEDARNLFAYYFRQDSFIFYSIYNFWVLPALAISTFLSYLFINGANLRDTQSLTIRMIPLLEDPATMADFKMKFWYLRYFGNFVLLASLVFGCAFSPLTSITANDFNFFFGFEVAFSLVGLIEAAVATAYAVHRCRRSWAAYEFVRSDTSYKRIVGGDTFFLLCEIIQLIYYCISLPLCCSLLKEHFNCVISPGQYATYFITLRAVFLLRIMPRQYTLSFINDWIVFAAAGMTIVIYFVASASAIADFSHTAENSLPSARTWRAAFDALLRQTFTSAVPKSFAADWTAFNISHTAMQMSASNTTVLEIANDYDSYTFLFILATIGKAVVASAIGLGTAFCLIPLSTLYLSPLPPKATLLFNTLSGGMREILKQGTMKHDDLRPDFRRKLQERKFKRIFENEGIPSWSLPHLLEELAICRPNYQRRFMYVLEQLLQYLPISEDRQSKVKEYMDSYDCYCSGGPAALSFDSLPVFPPETPHNMANPLSDTAVAKPRYIQPLRLVQALAIFELGFPSDSSMGTKLWIDFFPLYKRFEAPRYCSRCGECTASRKSLIKIRPERSASECCSST
ncbi:hypothetical protein ADEAN_000655700 [Angomonas deanei]|uniref:Uncharacterized protein n=1 Tax=Angomonas deanei TaxID=59799 RepID=A0A7G2CJE6_9TRYP|nr:hypothetical protein ADEAN_000655700 [Angomonas deanei]